MGVSPSHPATHYDRVTAAWNSSILERFWLDGLMGYTLMVAERPGER